jgi:hypothetical protein
VAQQLHPTGTPQQADSNGVPLPSSNNSPATATTSTSETNSTGTTASVQEVANHGQATISGTLNATDCKNASNVTIPCSSDAGLDLTQVTIPIDRQSRKCNWNNQTKC